MVGPAESMGLWASVAVGFQACRLSKSMTRTGSLLPDSANSERVRSSVSGHYSLSHFAPLVPPTYLQPIPCFDSVLALLLVTPFEITRKLSLSLAGN